MTHSVVATLGLLFALAGVLLLFRYGMPYRIETQGAVLMAWEDEDAKRAERPCGEPGMLGLVLIAVDTALPIGTVRIG